MKVYFIGAGPGDPELLTIKAHNIIKKAHVIIYAGSLVNPEVLEGHRPDARIYDSAGMHLEQIFEVITQARAENKDVARVHTGDPSIYGAIGEQIVWLKKQGIEFEVIPGVSSFCAAAAALKTELTAPEISQTIILTRMGDRTSVPEKEELAKLAAHQATLVIFLSVHKIEELVSRLLEGGYSPQTPAAVVVRASWADERKIVGTIEDIASKVKEAGIKKTALIIVGHALESGETCSRLYARDFSHDYRE